MQSTTHQQGLIMSDASPVRTSALLASLDWLDHAFLPAGMAPPEEIACGHQRHTATVVMAEEAFPRGGCRHRHRPAPGRRLYGGLPAGADRRYPPAERGGGACRAKRRAGRRIAAGDRQADRGWRNA